MGLETRSCRPWPVAAGGGCVSKAPNSTVVLAKCLKIWYKNEAARVYQTRTASDRLNLNERL